MSGVATGWVGRNGPRPDDINRFGDPYAGRARGLRMALIAVADSANADGKHSHPGIENVASFTLYSVGQARRLLTELVDEGWLMVTEEGGGRGRATVYDLVYDNHHRNPRTMSMFDDDKRAHGAPETRAPQPETRAPQPETRASGCAPNGLPTDATTPPTRGPVDPDSDIHPLFAPFWEVYPRREGKGAARAAYAKAMLAGVDPQDILDGLERIAPTWADWQARGRGQYVPMPATWLNQERWTDEPPPVVREVSYLDDPAEIPRPPVDESIADLDHHEPATVPDAARALGASSAAAMRRKLRDGKLGANPGTSGIMAATGGDTS